MYWRISLILLAFYGRAFAQDIKPEAHCFLVVPPVSNTALSAPIKLNTCTGESWLLVRTPIDKIGGYTYVWEPLAHADQAPALHDSTAFQR